MTKITTALTILLTIGTTTLWAQAPSQPRPPQTLSMYLQGQYANIKNNLIATAEKIPAEHFSFRPTPEVRTVAELFGHTMEAQYSYCTNVKGGANPATGKQFEKTVTAKADVVKMVKDAFAYCDKVHAGMTDTAGAAVVKFFTGDMAKLSILEFNTHHDFEHYGNMVTYMRLKGLVPPSSEPRK